MAKKLARNETTGAGRPAELAVDRTSAPEAGTSLLASVPLGEGQEQALALQMGLPGTRLDMVLGGPHPMLVDLVRHLARTAARADHAGTQPTSGSDDTLEESL